MSTSTDYSTQDFSGLQLIELHPMNDLTRHCHHVYHDTVLGTGGTVTDELGISVTFAASPRCENIREEEGLDSSKEEAGSWTLQEKLVFNAIMTGP